MQDLRVPRRQMFNAVRGHKRAGRTEPCAPDRRVQHVCGGGLCLCVCSLVPPCTQSSAHFLFIRVEDAEALGRNV